MFQEESCLTCDVSLKVWENLHLLLKQKESTQLRTFLCGFQSWSKTTMETRKTEKHRLKRMRAEFLEPILKQLLPSIKDSDAKIVAKKLKISDNDLVELQKSDVPFFLKWVQQNKKQL
jgi:hypothetical protein